MELTGLHMHHIRVHVLKHLQFWMQVIYSRPSEQTLASPWVITCGILRVTLSAMQEAGFPRSSTGIPIIRIRPCFINAAQQVNLIIPLALSYGWVRKTGIHP